MTIESVRVDKLSLRIVRIRADRIIRDYEILTPIGVENRMMMWWIDVQKANEAFREKYGMAKPKKWDGAWKGFVDVKLSDEQREQYASWDVQDVEVWEGLAIFGEAGNKFSLTYNRQNDTWNAAYTCNMEGSPNAGYTVTGFAPTPYEATRVLLFKMQCVLPDDWSDYKPAAEMRIG